MNIPLSWLKDYVDIDLPLDELARVMTMLGLEVDQVQLVGLPDPYDQAGGQKTREFKFTGLSWQANKIVVAAIDEVMPHPNADRLVLCRLRDGRQEHIVLTGAPNLYPYKGLGSLDQPLKVAYALEGAQIYDGHQPGQVLTILKRTKIRGVESYSMVCSEKELGISDEHEGVIILDSDAPVGMPLADYMGDAVFEISILPNMIRNASVVGVAREIAAATGKPLRKPPADLPTGGPSIAGQAAIEIRRPDLNPRFVTGLIRDVTIGDSPYKIQRRLRLAGMRPINNMVDATNYVMLETGQPLHAFDYDRLVERAGGQPPTIITRTAEPGEKLTTLDGVERSLDDFTVLVCDTAGALSIAGVMGGAETEVSPQTKNILLEGAAWNFINIRRTVMSQKLQSEAGYRFSRGVHPALAEWGVSLCLRRMLEWGGGQVASGLIDAYLLPAESPANTLSPADVKRLLGIEISAVEIAALLERLEFTCRVEGSGDGAVVHIQAPDHRLDVGSGETGKADLVEEVARLYGYDRIPSTRLADELPPQRSNERLDNEERVRDILVSIGLQEVITYRMTSPEREQRIYAPGRQPSGEEYIHLLNPIAPERSVMRRSLLASVLEVVERNARLSDRLAIFEIGPVFLPNEGQTLPDEPRRLVITLSGKRRLAAWDVHDPADFDFFDLKGMIVTLLDELHVEGYTFEPAAGPAFHPGKCAVVKAGGIELGWMGELHPVVKGRYDFADAPVLAADLDIEALQQAAPALWLFEPVPAYPPVLEDIALIVDEDLPAERVEALIRQMGGKLLREVRLFDIFRGGQIGAGKKSLAYSLTYQALDRTLDDRDAAQIRNKIVRRLEQELGARLRR